MYLEISTMSLFEILLPILAPYLVVLIALLAWIVWMHVFLDFLKEFLPVSHILRAYLPMSDSGGFAEAQGFFSFLKTSDCTKTRSSVRE